MIFEVDNVKGFSDYLPPESLMREAIINIAKKNYHLHGFLPIESPIIEFDELMKPSALPLEENDDAVSERFRLKDRAGRNLGLRYEFTFQLARIFKQNPNIGLPLRKYQIGPVFRDEPVRLGRTRQFIQCDADIIGDSSIKADFECICLIKDILNELNLPFLNIKVNNLKLISSILESVEINAVKSIMRELDKLDKIGEDSVKLNLKKYANSNTILTLFKLMEKPLDFFRENAFEGSQEVESLIKMCSLAGISLKFSPNLMRGFDYYTGNIFEVSPPGKSSIMGGGRYDKLIGRFLNKEIPAVGVSFSIESIMANFPSELSSIKTNQTPKIIIISIGKDKESINLSKSLRNSGISCSIFYGNIGKSLEYANSFKVPFVAFLGDLEIAKKKLRLRDMHSGQEIELTEKQLIKKLSQ